MKLSDSKLLNLMCKKVKNLVSASLLVLMPSDVSLTWPRSLSFRLSISEKNRKLNIVFRAEQDLFSYVLFLASTE